MGMTWPGVSDGSTLANQDGKGKTGLAGTGGGPQYPGQDESLVSNIKPPGDAPVNIRPTGRVNKGAGGY